MIDLCNSLWWGGSSLGISEYRQLVRLIQVQLGTNQVGYLVIVCLLMVCVLDISLDRSVPYVG